VARQPGLQKEFAPSHLAHDTQQCLGVAAFGQKATHPQRHHVGSQVGLVMHAEHHDRQRRVRLLQRKHQFHDMQARH